MINIKFQNLSKSYRHGLITIDILKNLSFKIDGPGIFCFFGLSGVGKTTLLNLIAGIINCDSGEIVLNKNKRTSVGYVFQEDYLLPWKTLEENIDLVLPTDITPTIRKNIIREKLSLLGMADKLNKYPDMLSGGEKQRANIARALSIDPDILLLDEPFSHIDEITASKLRFELVRILENYSKIIIINTHNFLEAIYLADAIFILKHKPVSFVKKLKINIPRPRNHYLYNDFILQPMIRKYLHSLMKSIDL